MIYKALTIAGSDSGGGAGIQADLKTFQELEVYGMSVVTAVTAQNTLGVQGIYPMTDDAVKRQIQSISDDLTPDAIKTGMLFSVETIRTVSQMIDEHSWKKIVVDPVMIAKGGASLLESKAVEALRKLLLPKTYVLTPNIPEAEVLTGITIRTIDDKKEVSKRLMEMGPNYIILKGGHEETSEYVADLMFDGNNFIELTNKRVKTKNTHGTGCTFSAVITAQLAKGNPVSDAFYTARAFIQQAIENHLNIGQGHGPTNHWAYMKNRRENI